MENIKNLTDDVKLLFKLIGVTLCDYQLKEVTNRKLLVMKTDCVAMTMPFTKMLIGICEEYKSTFTIDCIDTENGLTFNFIF